MADHFAAVAFIVNCSPPFSAYEGTAFPDELMQVWRWCDNNAPGEATAITAFTDFNVIEQTHNPVLSPDGTKILFEALSVFNWREIWVVDSTPGSTPTQLVADGGGGAGASADVIHPSWGPDSDTFLYVHCQSLQETRGGTIYKDTVSSPGSPTSLKTSTSPDGLYRPMFNFDGTRIAYVKDINFHTSGDLRCMDADGTNDTSLDNTINGYNLTFGPPQISWANTQNLIAYDTSTGGSNAIYVIADDGTGKTQLNANGDAAGAAATISAFAWPADDSFVVITALLAGPSYWSVVRAEVDGSTTTSLSDTIGTNGGSYWSNAIVYRGRIWFIESIGPAPPFKIGSMLIDGTDEVTNFNNSLGAGNFVADLGGGDGFYFS